jgi:hypothetical protein
VRGGDGAGDGQPESDAVADAGPGLQATDGSKSKGTASGTNGPLLAISRCTAASLALVCSLIQPPGWLCRTAVAIDRGAILTLRLPLRPDNRRPGKPR